MRRTTRFAQAPALAVAALVAVVMLATACGGGDSDDEDKPVSAPPRVVTEGGESVVTFDAATLAHAGLTIEPLQAVTHQVEVTAYGSVLDLTGLAEASGAIATARARIAGAQAVLRAARAEYERTKALNADDNAASQKALEQAAAAFHTAEAETHGAQAGLASLAADSRQRWGTVIAGWLEHGSPRLDALLRQRDRLAQLTVPAGTTLESAPDTATLDGGRGAGITAHLVSPAPSGDPRIQGESLLFAVPAGPLLLPGASVTATLPAGAPSTGVAVPAGAVVLLDGTSWVYVERSAGRFVRRRVATDVPLTGGWFVSQGLVPGDRVVVQGAQLLLSEEGRAAVHGSEG